MDKKAPGLAESPDDLNHLSREQSELQMSEDFYNQAKKLGNVPAYMLDAELEDTENGLQGSAFRAPPARRGSKKKKKSKNSLDK